MAWGFTGFECFAGGPLISAAVLRKKDSCEMLIPISDIWRWGPHVAAVFAAGLH